MGKKKRTHKVSNGTGVGSKKVPMTALQLVLMNKGMYASWKPAKDK